MLPRTILALVLSLACSAGIHAGDAGGSVISIEAVNELRAAATTGDPAAMLRVAQLYEQGVRAMDGTLIIPRNHGEAFKLYVAAAAGDIIPEALFAVGVCYELGLGVAPDPAKAMENYQKAGRLRYLPAYLKIAELLIDRQDVDRGLEFLEAAFREGNGDAAYQLALVHFQGRFGKSVDQARGVQWLSEAAARGQLAAIQAMAELRLNGVDGLVEKDITEAMKWYLIMAKVGQLSQDAAQKAQALQNGMTQAETAAANDNAVKWLRELEAVQTAARDAAQKAAEQRFAAFKAARPTGR